MITLALGTIGIILTSYLQPQTSISCGQQTVNGFIHWYNTINANFNGTLNAIPHMVFAARKENDECYNFKEMLAQLGRQDFLEEMLKRQRNISLGSIGWWC